MKKGIKGFLVFLVLISIVETIVTKPIAAASVDETFYEAELKLPWNKLGGELEYLGTRPDGVFYLATNATSEPDSKGNRLQNYVIAIDPSTLKIVWKHAIYGKPSFELEKKLIRQDDRIYGVVGYNANNSGVGTKVFAINSEGKKEWEIILDSDLFIHGFVNDKLLVNNLYEVYAIDKTGKITWKKEIPQNSQPSYKLITNLYSGGYALSSFIGKYRFAEITDWSLNTKVRYTLPAKSTLKEVQSFGKNLFVIHVEFENKKKLIIAIDSKGQTKWKRSIDSSTERLYMIDSKLMFANSTGFYALDTQGKVLNHSKLNKLYDGYSYRLKVETDRIYIRSSQLVYPLNPYLIVYDRKTLKELDSFGNPTLRIANSYWDEFDGGTYYDALFYDKGQLYALIFGELNKLKIRKE